MQHFDLTGDKFLGTTTLRGDDKNPMLVLQTGGQYAAVANVTFTLRLGSLTPVAARELWETLDDAPQPFLEYLAQYYFDTYGEDISDPR